MRKIIVATTGLMLVGALSAGVVSTASAATINFSGDARARFYYQDNYGSPLTLGANGVNRPDTSQTFWQSRVRLVFKIETKGGAYAVGRFRLLDSYPKGWDNGAGGAAGWSANGATANDSTSPSTASIRADIGYVGLPLGPVTIEAGTGVNTMDEFFRADNFYNFIRGKYTGGNTTVQLFMEKFSEYQQTGTVTSIDAKTGLAVSKTIIDDNYTSDDDVNHYGLRLIQKFNNSWQLDTTLFVLDNQQNNDGNTGFGWTGVVTGKINDVSVIVGGAYKSSDYMKYEGSLDDNGYGIYAGVNVPIGIASVSAVVGGTFNGYLASGDFGGDGQEPYVPFIMLSNASSTEVIGMLNTGIRLGSATGDAWFVNVAPSVKISDKLTLTGECTYAQVDVNMKNKSNLSLWEVGGIASYAVTDGAKISALLGYLNIEDSDNQPLGFGLALDLAF